MRATTAATGWASQLGGGRGWWSGGEGSQGQSRSHAPAPARYRSACRGGTAAPAACKPCGCHRDLPTPPARAPHSVSGSATLRRLGQAAQAARGVVRSRAASASAAEASSAVGPRLRLSCAPPPPRACAAGRATPPRESFRPVRVCWTPRPSFVCRWRLDAAAVAAAALHRLTGLLLLPLLQHAPPGRWLQPAMPDAPL